MCAPWTDLVSAVLITLERFVNNRGGVTEGRWILAFSHSGVLEAGGKERKGKGKNELTEEV